VASIARPKVKNVSALGVLRPLNPLMKGFAHGPRYIFSMHTTE